MDSTLKTGITLVLLFIIFIIVMGMIFLLLVAFERNKKIKKLSKKLNYFSVDKLNLRIESYQKEMNGKLEFESLVTAFDDINKRDYILIKKELTKLSSKCKPLDVISYPKFGLQLKTLLKKVQEFQEEYSRISFELTDLTSDIEVEKAVIKKLQSNMYKVVESITNSPIKRINESENLRERVVALRKEMKKIQEMVELEGKHLTSAFLTQEELIVKLIEDLRSCVTFMNDNIKHVDTHLDFLVKNVISVYNEHKAILEELEDETHTNVKKYAQGKKYINDRIDNLDFVTVDKGIKELNALVDDLNVLINSNIDYAKFNKKNDFVPPKLLEYVSRNHSIFTSEIRRHMLEDEETRLLYVNRAQDELVDTVANYEREIKNISARRTPASIHGLLVDVIHAYERYVEVLIDNVKDISSVNSSTNDINIKIAKMNVSLLQVEYNISSLKGVRRTTFEKEKEALQSDVRTLRNHFQDNTEKISDDVNKAVEKVGNKVEELVSKARGASFEHAFIKETILYINRYKGNDDRMDDLIESMKESFENERFTETLRKAKEIIEIYGIK